MILSPLLLAVFERVLHFSPPFVQVFFIFSHFFGGRVNFIGYFSDFEALRSTAFKLGITDFQTGGRWGELV